MSTPKTPEMISQMIEALEHPSRELTEWEDNFRLSIKIQHAKGRELSDKQFDTLERIYAEKTS